MTEWIWTWGAAFVFILVMGWFAKAGAAVRAQRTGRAWLAFLRDVALVTSVAVAGFAIVTEGRGCSGRQPCLCDDNDTSCIDQICR